MTRIFNQVVISLLASAAMAAAAPVMRLTATTVGVTIGQGTNASPQTVQAYNIGDGTLSPQVTSSASWVAATIGPASTCTIAQGTGCALISLTFSTTSLTAGTHSALVEVVDPNAVDSPQSIVVTVTVGTVPTSLTLYAPPSGGKPTATFYTHGPVSTQVSTATGGSWLSVALLSTFGGAFVPYQVTADSAAISTPGTYTGSIVVSGSTAAPENTTIPVTFNVTTSPIAQLSAPALNVALGSTEQISIPITVGNLGQGSLSVSGATATMTTGSGWLTAVVASGGGSVSVTLNPALLLPGVYQGSVVITTNAVNNSALTVPVSLVVTQQSGPQLGVGGVVDNASYQTTLAPGDIGAAFGVGISSQAAANAPSLPLPTTLGGTQILVGGVAAPLYFTSSGQLDFQVPYETPAGLTPVQVVSDGQAGNQVSITVAPRVPRIPLLAGNAPIIINYADGSVPVATTTLLPNHPAKRGDTLIIYAIGLGQTNPVAVTGAAAGLNGLQNVAPPVAVMLGGLFSQTVQVTPLFAGLAPGFAGLYQVNVTIPQNAPTGNSVTLTVNVQGASTNPVNIAIE